MQLEARDLRVGDQITAGLPSTTTVAALRIVTGAGGEKVRVTTTTLGTVTLDDRARLTVTRPGNPGADEPAYDVGLDVAVAAAMANDDSQTTARLRAGVEGIRVHDGTTGGGTRPTGYARVRWVGGTARPTNMAAGDLWERDA